MFLENATISYTTTASDLVATDPITGEPVFSPTENTESFRLSIETKIDRANVSALPGIDSTGLFCQGRAKAVPSWYTPGSKLKIAWDNGKQGDFYVLPTLGSRLGLESVFGQPVSGVLLSNSK